MTGPEDEADPPPAAMTPERWRVVEAVLQAALDRPAAERPAFLATACGADATLRREVESLLDAAPTTGFLERPAVADVTGAVRLSAALAGRYVVARELGRGGMAAVYLARDLRHRRDVAVKVLHPELSALLGPERFLKEIELTASLQHPHILPLFDSGSADGQLYYVMPYVEGETLRARLERERQLPVADAVRIATEVADALAYAHARGVVHRDVKPENVLLHGGHALVADFGIALAVRHAGGQRMTQTGLSLGTPQYMAPEQAMGERAVDARADVYALGAVTYEMLAGEPPFTGPTAQAIVARVITEAPKPLTGQRPSVPAHVDAAVRTALEKLPADRHPSAAAFAAALAEPTAHRGGVAADAGARASPARRVRPRTAALLAAGGLVTLALGWVLGRTSGRASAVAAGPAARGAVRFAIGIDSGAFGSTGPAISPDGRTIVFSYEGADGARLYARRVDELAMRPLAGTENGEQPFFSPDGAWVAFHSHGALRKVPLGGGAAVVLAKVPWFGGGAWGPDDTIYYAEPTGNALYRVPARGGTASRIPIGDTAATVFNPHPLPGGRAVLVTVTKWSFGERFGVVELATGRLRELGSGYSPRYVAGHIVYGGSAGELYRQPFDLEAREPTGTPERIATGLAYLTNGVAFDVTPAGAFVYRVGGSVPNPELMKLAVTDRAGRELRVVPARVPWAPRFSPDGRHVAYGANAPGQEASDVWVTELAAGTTQRVTTDGNNNNDPQWSPDARTIAYSANADGAKDAFAQSLDGGGARRLMRRPGFQLPTDWLPDGSALLFVDEHAGNHDVWVWPAHGGAARPFVATPAREVGARASPDGRWVAYTANETGRDEVYLQSYPVPGRKTLVSAGGGLHPVWRRDGRELYYWQADQLIAARVELGGGGEPPAVRERTPLFRAPYPGGAVAMYDASPDGSQFVLVTGQERANQLVVVLDGFGAGAARRARGR